MLIFFDKSEHILILLTKCLKLKQMNETRVGGSVAGQDMKAMQAKTTAKEGAEKNMIRDEGTKRDEITKREKKGTKKDEGVKRDEGSSRSARYVSIFPFTIPSPRNI